MTPQDEFQTMLAAWLGIFAFVFIVLPLVYASGKTGMDARVIFCGLAAITFAILALATRRRAI